MPHPAGRDVRRLPADAQFDPQNGQRLFAPLTEFRREAPQYSDAELWRHEPIGWRRAGQQRTLNRFMVDDELKSVARMTRHAQLKPEDFEQVWIKVDDRSSSMRSKVGAVIKAEHQQFSDLISSGGGELPRVMVWNAQVSDQVRLVYPRRGAVSLDEMRLATLNTFHADLRHGSCISDGVRFAVALACSYAKQGVTRPIKVAVTTDGANIHPSMYDQPQFANAWRDRSEIRAVRWIGEARQYPNINIALFGYIRETPGAIAELTRFTRSLCLKPEENRVIFVRRDADIEASVGQVTRHTTAFLSEKGKH